MCTTPKAKANAFLQEYAEVSGRRSDRKSRRPAVEVNLRLKAPGVPQEIEEPFTAEELTAAINSIKVGKAAGPDELASDYIRKLPQSVRGELLKVYNYRWASEWIPQSWREATIIPVLKKGKDPAAVNSFRPISLTSHLGKTMERLVLARMNWWLEQTNAISPLQLGFRKGRSTVDNCLRLSQRVSDCFQQKPPQRTILTLFDYAKAFDTVLRSGLLLKMIEMGIPSRYTRWIKAWLVNRKGGGVKVGDSVSRPRVFRAGLPQGAVLSPVLFVIYLNELLGRFSGDTFVSAYADDLAIACSNKSKEQAQIDMQREVDLVRDWSKEWRLTLAAEKCQTTFFTTGHA